VGWGHGVEFLDHARVNLRHAGIGGSPGDAKEGDAGEAGLGSGVATGSHLVQEALARWSELVDIAFDHKHHEESDDEKSDEEADGPVPPEADEELDAAYNEQGDEGEDGGESFAGEFGRGGS